MSRTLRIFAWIGGIVVGLAMVVTIATLVFPWNWLRGPLDRRLSEATGRSIAVDGPLSVHLGWTTTLRADDVRIANTPWAQQPDMLRIKRFIVSVYVPALFRGRRVLPELRLDGATIDLEKDAKGQDNWHFANPKAKAVKAAAIPQRRSEVPIVENLVINRSRLTYRDPAKGINFSSLIDTAVGGDPIHQRVRLDGHGTFNGTPFRLALEGGSILSLRNESKPYPLRIEARIGETRGSIDGTVTAPLQLAGFDLDMHVAGNDLAEIFPVFGIPLPHTQPYALHGRLAREGQTWIFHDFAGRVGNSDLSGNASLTQRGPRPKLTATVVSENVDIKDLLGMVGAAPKPQETDRVLPNEPFNLDKLRSMDMNVHFEGRRVIAPHLPLHRMDAALVMEDGRATLNPISFDMARGKVTGTATLDSRQAPPGAKVDLNISDIKLRDFFANTPFANQIEGTLAGRIDLTGNGHSTAEVLGHSDGQLSLFMGGGRFSDLAVRLAGLEIAKALGLIATEDKPQDVRCLVTSFYVNHGLATAGPMVLDTTASAVTGHGTVNLSDETINLRLSAHSKQPAILKVHSDVLVGGTFKHPSVGLDPAAVAAQGTAAAVLGTLLTPLGALLPFIDLGLGKDSPCRQMIDQAQAGAQSASRGEPSH